MKKPLLIYFVFLSLVGNYSCRDHSSPIVSERKFIISDNFDSTVKPADNFYLYVNGKWQKSAIIPPTETNTGAFLDVYNRTKDHLKLILDSVSKTTQTPGSLEQKVGDLYASGMDSDLVEKLGYQPVLPFLQTIHAFKTPASVMDFEAAMQKNSRSYIISMSIFADQKNSRMNIPNFYQTGIGLPDRDYYFKTDPATVAIQQAYLTYMAKIFTLTGTDSAEAKKKASGVYALEKQFATVHRTNVALRDPQSNYNKMAVADLNKKMPVIGWTSFLPSIGVKSDSIDIGQPAYYTRLNALLKTVPIGTWQDYYAFHVLDDAAPSLSSPFVNAKFEYTGRALNGQQEIKPRWERIYQSVDNNLGEALGQLYVKKYFSEDAKKRMVELVNNLQISFGNRIDKLTWMSDSTKQVAKEKLHAFLKKIGYTDKWRDYSKVSIDKTKYFDNLLSCAKNEYAYQISKVGKPVDRTEWGMTPPTINAYYNPTFNEIVFPAGILQYPFFDLDADDAMNYGAIGMAIGHEMTHGFDDQGAQYDKDGNLKNWWGKQDNLQFTSKAKKVIDFYNHFTVLDTVHVNGSLTTGENIADMGGVSIAYDAFKMTKEGQDSTKIDGFTPDQRFFISFAQIWRSKIQDKSVLQSINTNPHSPPMHRVNGPLMNFEPFYTAFHVMPGDKMYLPDSTRIKIW